MTTIKAKIDEHTAELLAEYVERTNKDVCRKSHQITDATDAEIVIGNLISAALTTNQQKILRALERIEDKLGKLGAS